MFVENEINLARLMIAICLGTLFFTVAIFFMFPIKADAPVAPLPEYKMEPVTTITARP